MEVAVTNAELARLARHILDTHHARAREELPAIESALTRARAPGALVRPVAGLRMLLEQHMMKEEHILFPRFLALPEMEEGAALGVEAPIRGMQQEHDELRTLEHEIRAGLDGAGEHRAALDAFLVDLAEHARVEDEQLFADALRREGVPEGQVLPAPWSPPKARPAAARPSPRRAPEPERRGLRDRVRALFGKG